MTADDHNAFMQNLTKLSGYTLVYGWMDGDLYKFSNGDGQPLQKLETGQMYGMSNLDFETEYKCEIKKASLTEALEGSMESLPDMLLTEL